MRMQLIFTSLLLITLVVATWWWWPTTSSELYNVAPIAPTATPEPSPTPSPTYPIVWPPTPPPDLEMPPVPPGLPGQGRNRLDPDAWLGFIQSHDILADSYYTTGMYCPAFNPSDGYTSITSRVEVESNFPGKGDPDERVSVTCLGCAEEPGSDDALKAVQ